MTSPSPKSTPNNEFFGMHCGRSWVSDGLVALLEFHFRFGIFFFFFLVRFLSNSNGINHKWLSPDVFLKQMAANAVMKLSFRKAWKHRRSKVYYWSVYRCHSNFTRLILDTFTIMVWTSQEMSFKVFTNASRSHNNVGWEVLLNNSTLVGHPLHDQFIV